MSCNIDIHSLPDHRISLSLAHCIDQAIVLRKLLSTTVHHALGWFRMTCFSWKNYIHCISRCCIRPYFLRHMCLYLRTTRPHIEMLCWSRLEIGCRDKISKSHLDTDNLMPWRSSPQSIIVCNPLSVSPKHICFDTVRLFTAEFLGKVDIHRTSKPFNFLIIDFFFVFINIWTHANEYLKTLPPPP